MPGQFDGKVALVTGAATGIGRASAMAFAREGAKVVVSDIEAAGAEETVSFIKAEGGEAVFIKADVSNEDEIRFLIEKTIETFGRLDCAHNNAGIEGPLARLADCPEKEWMRTIEVNLKGVWLCMKYEIPEMLKLGNGTIVNTASIAGVVGLKKSSAYSASKHGIIGLTQTAALEYIRDGIRVNAVCPGLIDTEMVERSIVGEAKPDSGISEIFRDVKKFVGQKVLTMKQPAGRMGLAAEVAQAVVWLSSDAASFVNGHALAVDGGFLAK